MKANRILQKIFQAYYPSYAQRHALPLKHRKAAEALVHCRTVSQGYSHYRCDFGHADKKIYHACRHRSCPVCASRKQYQWQSQQRERLLPCRHYHLVFTIPSEYRVLWQYNTAWFTQALFESSRQTIFELLADPKYLGAKPGLIMSLHSWGRQLNLHPHVHGLLTGGGVDPAGQWKNVDRDFLLPIRVVKALYRGKMQARIKTAAKEGTLKLPPDMTASQLQQLMGRLYRKNWSVRIQPPYEYGHGVIHYLSRYIAGGAFKASQLVKADSREIHFQYQSHKTGRKAIMRLSKDEFMRRLLLHVPEPGVHTVRHYGLYAAACKAREPIRAHWKKSQTSESEEKVAIRSQNPIKCGRCRTEMKLVLSVYPPRQKGNSYLKESTLKDRTAFVQPDVQAASLSLAPP